MSDSSGFYQSQLDQLDEQIAQNQALLNDPELSDLAQEEISLLEQQKAMLLQAATEADAWNSDSSENLSERHVNCIIELRPGAGGDEAKIWASDLLRMYSRFAEQLGLKFELIDDLVLRVKGKTHVWLHSLSLDEETQSLLAKQTINWLTEGVTAYELFRFELGVHRVQRVPATESQGRIHTSTASVAVLPEVHPKAVEIREEDIEWQFMRASGAGGQHVNKTNSAARLIHKPSGIVVVARQERQQNQNREIALQLLRSQLWELEAEARMAKLGQARQGIGRNMRAEKIRTYNYPQNRVTDHRIKVSWHSLDTILEGSLHDLIWAITKESLLESQDQTELEAES